jgi:mannose-1-phosphate guanylyltransferase
VTDDAAGPWAVVLAGGEGMRLRSVTRAIVGDDRPKQYVPLISADSLLRQTMARAARLSPTARTLVVSQQRHADWLAADLGAHREPKLLLQPENRDTAAGIMLPAYWIAARDPDATVVVYPSDHFVLEEAAFMAHVAEVVAFVERQRDGIVLVGARAMEPDTEYGWIEPGDTVGATASGSISRVARFREKPTPQVTAMCLAREWLWNTFVMVAKASTLVSVADVLLPGLHRRLTAATPFLGTRREAWALEEAYASLPRQNFSEAVLQAGLPFLAVSALPPLTWSDLGTPQRLFKLLRILGISPAWMCGRRSPGGQGRPGSRVNRGNAA